MNVIQAIELAHKIGVYCRPKDWGPCYALEIGDGLFFEVTGGRMVGPYPMKPEDLMGEWELVTKDTLIKELEDSEKSPF